MMFCVLTTTSYFIPNCHWIISLLLYCVLLFVFYLWSWQIYDDTKSERFLLTFMMDGYVRVWVCYHVCEAKLGQIALVSMVPLWFAPVLPVQGRGKNGQQTKHAHSFHGFQSEPSAAQTFVRLYFNIWYYFLFVLYFGQVLVLKIILFVWSCSCLAYMLIIIRVNWLEKWWYNIHTTILHSLWWYIMHYHLISSLVSVDIF